MQTQTRTSPISATSYGTELEKTSNDLAESEAKRDARYARLRALATPHPTPTARYEEQQIGEQLPPIIKDIQRLKLKKAELTLEERRGSEPAKRADYDRRVKEANRKMDQAFTAPIAKLAAAFFENPEAVTSAVEAMEAANEAYWRWEQATGETAVGLSRPVDFDRGVGRVLRALYAFGASEDPLDANLSSRLTSPVPVGGRHYNFPR